MKIDDTSLDPVDAFDDEGGDEDFGDEDAFANFERFSAYVDGELSDEDKKGLEAELEADPLLKEDFEAFKETLSVVSSFAHADVEAPESFVDGVESRIRIRSRGRFFNDDFFYRSRVPYEVFAILMLGIMAALLYFGEAHYADSDLAAAGSQQGKQEPLAKSEDPTLASPTKEGDSVKGNAFGGDKATPAEVAPIRREIVIYTILVQDDAPRFRAETIASQVRSTDRRFSAKVSADSDDDARVEIKLPHTELESAVGAFGKLGTVQRSRAWVEGAVPQERTLVIRVGTKEVRPGVAPLGVP